jgi:hypothetical protein
MPEWRACAPSVPPEHQGHGIDFDLYGTSSSDNDYSGRQPIAMKAFDKIAAGLKEARALVRKSNGCVFCDIGVPVDGVDGHLIPARGAFAARWIECPLIRPPQPVEAR